MNIGFYIKWNKGSLYAATGNVIGDELISQSLADYLNQVEGVCANVYAPNFLPAQKLDFMIYMNDTPPEQNFAARHICYMQNGHAKGGSTVLKKNLAQSYDGYLFYSHKLLDLYRQSGGSHGEFMPFGVDDKVFYPRNLAPEYAFDCAYIGNDIKGKKRTDLFLRPALDFNFGLFGNWTLPKLTLRNRLGLACRGYRFYHCAYQKEFARISKGKIAQNDVPTLYSSAKINLNCTLQDCVDMDVINLRILEVLACRGFLITDRVPAAEKLLQGCAVFTDGGKDLTEKIRYYLARGQERAEIAQRGYEYVTKNATIDARASGLINFLKSFNLPEKN